MTAAHPTRTAVPPDTDIHDERHPPAASPAQFADMKTDPALLRSLENAATRTGRKRMVKLSVREALLLVLDQVDYTKGACAPTEMVAACLSTDVIDTARAAIAASQAEGEAK